MYPQLLKHLPAALLGVVLLGCSAPHEQLAENRLAVVGGRETGPDWAGIVYVTAEVRTFSAGAVVKIGSGTLIAPNLLATALHVVSKNPSNVPFTCDSAGNEVSGSAGALLGPLVAPEKVSIYAGPVPNADAIAHGALIVSSGSPTICQNDVAFVVLDTEIDLPTYPVHRGPPTEVGDLLTVIGYGTAPDAANAVIARTERAVEVTSVGQWIRTFTVSEGPCEGDSGGPALSQAGELVGVFSSVAFGCTGPNAAPKYTDISYFEPLVTQAFQAAGAESPWPTPSASAGSPAEAGQSNSSDPSSAGGAGAGQGGSSSSAGVAPTTGSDSAQDSGCSFEPRGTSAPHALGVAALLACLLRRRTTQARRRASS